MHSLWSMEGCIAQEQLFRWDQVRFLYSERFAKMNHLDPQPGALN